MIRIACAAVLAIGLVGVSSASAQSPDTIEHGKKVYAAQKCQACHSVQGVGNKKGPLDDVGARLSRDDIENWIVNAPQMTEKTKAARRPFMRAYKLSKEDLDALVAYMQSLKAKS